MVEREEKDSQSIKFNSTQRIYFIFSHVNSFESFNEIVNFSS